MNAELEKVSVNGVEYVRADQATKQFINRAGMKYVIVRCDRAGAFAGFLDKKTDYSVILVDARRLWYWDGAASLSQLAVDGVSKPENCKFPVEVPRIELLDAIEIIDASQKAKKSIDGVPIWKK